MRLVLQLLFWGLMGSLVGCQVAREVSTSRPEAKPAGTPAAASAPATLPPAEDTEPLLALGKEMFVARCGSCHNERGDKPLASGPPLNERKVTSEDIVRNVTNRFKNATDAQKRAVVLYLQSFMKKEVK